MFYSVVVQFLLSPLLLWQSFVAKVLSNALYAVAFSYYHYITFLGYSALPFLSDTVVRFLRHPDHYMSQCHDCGRANRLSRS